MTRGVAGLTALVAVLALLPLAPGPFGAVPAHAAPPYAAPPFWPGSPVGLPPGWPPMPVWPGVPPATAPPVVPEVPHGVDPQAGRPKPPPVVPCRIRSGSRADFVFTAVLSDRGRQDQGRSFDLGAVQDLLIEVRWASLDVSARQRLELYAPDGHLFQMVTTTLPAHAVPVVTRVPVSGSWIVSATLAGTWCARVFLDDELAPAAADDFELRVPRAR